MWRISRAGLRHVLTIVGVILFAVLFLVICAFICYRHDYTTLHLSPAMCKYCLRGTSPEEFCSTRGAGTQIEGKYLFAKMDKDGCLILTLKNSVISEWKNQSLSLQVLQCVLGDERDIGITIDYSVDVMGFYMEDADTCKYDISEDFTKIVLTPEDSIWYVPPIFNACSEIQMFEGKNCKEIRVEYLRYDSNGEIVEKIVYPDDIVDTSNMTE